MTTHRFLARPIAAAVAALALSSFAVQAQSPAASACPDQAISPDNLAANPSFELPAVGVPVGEFACWQSGDAVPAQSAAAGWQMHTDNAGSRVCSRLVHSTAPGPGGKRMLAFQASGSESGLVQAQGLDPTKAFMFSVWVLVRSGQVAIASRGMNGGPVAWTTKVGEWEQLRVCTNSLSNTDLLSIYNQAADGGTFLVDRVELREIPIRE